MTLVYRAVPRLAVLLAMMLATLVPAAPADAHTKLTATSPESGATVPATTDRLVLSFNQSVSADLAQVVVTGPDAETAGTGAVSVSGTDVVQQLRSPLTPGTWTAAYRVVSPDGHPISGQFAFTVAIPAASPTATPAAATAPTAAATQAPTIEPSTVPAAAGRDAADDGSSALPVALGVLLVGAVVGAVVLLRRRDARAAGA